MVIYPIHEAGADGLQLVNWVAEIETPNYRRRDWNRAGSLDDFIGAFAELAFRLARRSRLHPCRGQCAGISDGRPGPVAALGFGRVTLLGDAAHPMVPRGSERRRTSDSRYAAR